MEAGMMSRIVQGSSKFQKKKTRVRKDQNKIPRPRAKTGYLARFSMLTSSVTSAAKSHLTHPNLLGLPRNFRDRLISTLRQFRTCGDSPKNFTDHRIRKISLFLDFLTETAKIPDTCSNQLGSLWNFTGRLIRTLRSIGTYQDRPKNFPDP